MNEDRPRRIALLMWGDAVEDFLEPIGWTLDRFLAEGSGGWLFGYIHALRLAGIETVLVVWSRDPRAPYTATLGSNGSRVRVFASPPAFRIARRVLGSTYRWVFDDARWLGRLPRAVRPVAGALRDAAPYLATPARDIERVIREERCEAILCQEYEDPRFDVAAGAAARRGVPVFATFQGGLHHRSRWEAPRRPRSIASAGGLFIGSSAEIERVRSHYGTPEERLHHVFNPLDTRMWFPDDPDDRRAARGELGVGEATPLVVWHGRVEVHAKGLDLLVAAWNDARQLLAGRGLLLLIGDGADRAFLGENLRRSRPGSVLWIDRYVADRSKLRRWLSAGDLYAFPSRREGFAVAPLEAMACGLPVVATDVTGVADVFASGEEHGGVVVPVDDVSAFTAALVRLARDPKERASMAAKARARVAQAFSPEGIGARLGAALRASWKGSR